MSLLSRYFFGASLFCFCSLIASARLGLHLQDRSTDLPLLTLPYGTWRAASYNSDGDIYVFKNIRYAAPPIGSLRWEKPAPPHQETGIHDGSYGPICVQTPFQELTLRGSGADSPIGEDANQFLGGIPIPSFTHASEDCLFLDLYVPGKAVRNTSLSLPIISWLCPGAFYFCGKDQFEPVTSFYSGAGVIQESDGNVIFVSSNYRVGTYGFLAGTTMEQYGVPNAGLHDQRAVFQWIKSFIHLVGGDPSNVSAWGCSSGASSIMHHLIAEGGTLDPLFSKAVLFSPAFAPMIDRKGKLEEVFQNFTRLAGCKGQGLECLRDASAESLKDANSILAKTEPNGVFVVGPSADGEFIRQAPALELASGNYWKGIQSLILSHTSSESSNFIPAKDSSDLDFNAYIRAQMPDYADQAGVSSLIEAHYPPIVSGTSHNYSTESSRFEALLGDSSFLCNTRYLTDAYANSTWNLIYAIPPGLHGSDIIATFYDANIAFSVLGTEIDLPLIPFLGPFAKAYQSYLTSHARTGNPNTFKKTINIPSAIHWPQPGGLAGDVLSNVLRAGDTGFKVVEDAMTKRSVCKFWVDALRELTAYGGYAPAGGQAE